jgi:two-component system phosphate regulon sensor histidine kinase PhoR
MEKNASFLKVILQGETIAFRTLVKALLVISATPILVFTSLMASGKLDIFYFLYGIAATLFGSAILVRPYLSNVQALKAYVEDIAQDRRVEAPELSFLGEIGELSGAVQSLHRSWELKKQQTENMLSEREILVDTIPDHLLMLDSDLQIIRTNSAARQRFGQRMAGKKLSEVVPSKELSEAVLRVISELNGQEIECYLPEPYDAYFRAKIERFPVISKGGISIIITLHDITELKRVEQMRADFVANASHEIRTPLASLIGFIETLQGPAKEDAKAREQFLKVMSEQAGRMSKLVNDLLSLSKMEMDSSNRPSGKVDLGKVIETVRANTEWEANQRNILVITDTDEDLPPVLGEETEIMQVVQNLVENAIKYGFADSNIEIRAYLDTNPPKDKGLLQWKRAVAISVSDQGEGIPKEHIPRLTERFYRVETSRSRKIRGSGLGLAIVKHIISRHRGLLTIESEQGVGSTFTVHFPEYEG